MELRYYFWFMYRKGIEYNELFVVLLKVEFNFFYIWD